LEHLEEAKKKYEAFHWGTQGKVKEATLPKPPKFAFAIGKIVSIAYETTKDGETATWEHEFGEEGGERPDLVADSKNHKLFIVGGDYKVEPRGIVD